MIFDDYFYRLTGGKGIDGADVVLGLKSVSLDTAPEDELILPRLITPKPEISKSEEEYPPEDYVIESDLIFPKINRAVRTGEKPVVLVIDDDFPTLDIMKIYLSRDYEYYGFSSAKEGLFFLNDNVADLIMLDCMIHTTKAENVVELIRNFRHCKDVPIIYLGEEGELYMVKDAIPAGVSGTLKRPVARGDLHGILDKYIKKDKQDDNIEDVS